MGKNNKKSVKKPEPTTRNQDSKESADISQYPPVKMTEDMKKLKITNNSDIGKSKIELCKKKLALLMMIKNEEKRITVSFDSVKEYTDTFIILDTGSTDSTISICRDYCEKNNIRLFLKEKPFINFMVSRNDSLDFADEVLKGEDRFMLFLDCNDELQNADQLCEFVSTYPMGTPQGPATGFYLKQKWWTGNNIDTYFNIRMCISNKGWRYKGVVHEYITNEKIKDGPSIGKDTIRLENVVLFQDRTKDDDKSFKRFFRDKELLFNEYLNNPKDPRTLFYLGQTCGCLGNLHEAYKYYILRSKEQGFIEEIYHSYFRLGEIAQQLNHPWEESMLWYLKAFEHSQRAEPLVKIAEYYLTGDSVGNKTGNMISAYMYASMACKMIFPSNQILFIDRRCYFYKRWHLLSKVAFYAQQYKEGKDACIEAIMAENQDVDMNNLIIYLKKDAEMNIIKLTGSEYPFQSLTRIERDNEIRILPTDMDTDKVVKTREEVIKRALTIMHGKK